MRWRLNDLCVLKVGGGGNSKLVSSVKRKLVFYRARVVELLANERYKVLCVDKGCYETNVSGTQLLALNAEHRHKPAFKSKRCSLHGVLPIGSAALGEWSALAKRFTERVLDDNFVYVIFDNSCPLSSSSPNDDTTRLYEVCIYMETSKQAPPSPLSRMPFSPLSPCSKGKSAASLSSSSTESSTCQSLSSAFVRFADLLNTKGLALLCEKKRPLEMLLASGPSQLTSQPQSPAVNKAALLARLDKLVADSFSFSYPPHRVSTSDYKVFNRAESTRGVALLYDVFATHVHSSARGHLYVHVHFYKLALARAKQLFDELYDVYEQLIDVRLTISANLTAATIDAYIDKQKKRGSWAKRQACVCRLPNGLYYRGEVMQRDNTPTSDKVTYRVRCIDYGFEASVPLAYIFRPMSKHLSMAPIAVPVRLLSSSSSGYSSSTAASDINNNNDDKALSVARRLVGTKTLKLYISTHIDRAALEDPANDYNGQYLIIGDLYEPGANMWLSSCLVNSTTTTSTNKGINEDLLVVQEEDIRRKLSANFIAAEQQHKTKQRVDYDVFRFPRNAKQLLAEHTSFTSPVIVSWLDDVEGVWLQLQSRDEAENEIGAVHDRLMQLEGGGNKALRRLEVAEIREGALCCCIFFDKHVYRARIVSVNFLELTARVFYVDFGNHENMAFDEYYNNSHLIVENISDKFDNNFFNMFRSTFIFNLNKTHYLSQVHILTNFIF